VFYSTTKACLYSPFSNEGFHDHKWKLAQNWTD
jgi:hypothetical protein